VREADANLAAAKQKAVADASRINEAKATQTATAASVAMALAMFRQAQTTVQSAQLDLSYTKIFAPCDGRVTRKAVEAGNYRSSGPATHVHRAGGHLGRRQFQGIAVEKNEARPAGAGGH
jgi:membrane fusion protein, multidrug efflux system